MSTIKRNNQLADAVFGVNGLLVQLAKTCPELEPVAVESKECLSKAQSRSLSDKEIGNYIKLFKQVIEIKSEILSQKLNPLIQLLKANHIDEAISTIQSFKQPTVRLNPSQHSR